MSFPRPRRLAAGDAQRFQKALGDGIGLAAGEPPRARRRVEALDRHHIGHAEAGEGVAHIAFADEAPHIRKLRRQRFDRFALAAGGIGQIVGEQRAGDLHLDRPRECPRRHVFAGAGLERKHGVVTGAAGMKQIDPPEIGLIARHRQAVGHAGLPGFEPGRGIERQQDRNRAAADAVEEGAGQRVQLHQCGRRTRIVGRHPPLAGEGKRRGDGRSGVDLGAELIEHRAPFDADGRDRGGAEFLGRNADGAGQAQQRRRQPTPNQPVSRIPQCQPPASFHCRGLSLILCAFDVRPVFRHYHDACPCGHMWRNRGAHAVGEDRRLVGR